MKYVTFIALSVLAHGALAQQAPAASGQKNDDLDVTMQIIVDPDAKLPDEVVRRIPLPERKATPSANPNAESESKSKGNDNSAAREAKELGREASQADKDRAKEQREQARREAAEERRRNNDNNNNNNGRPDPPGHQPHQPL